MQRLEVYFYGHVQGVGFRYTTQDIAKDFPVTGFVQNESDGSVYLVAEGDRGILEQFLNAIMERMRDFVREHHTEWSAATNRWSEFYIKR